MPYTQFREIEKTLDQEHRLNRDLERALHQAEVEMSGSTGNIQVTQSQMRELQRRYDDVFAAREQLQRDYDELRGQLENLEPLPIPTGFDAADAARLNLERTPSGAIVIGDVNFSAGSHALKSGPRKELDELARLLREKYPDRIIHIEGHTDNQPISKSKNADNWELSVKRAHSVFEYLVAKCGDPRVWRSHFRLHGLGYAMPAEGVQDPSSKEGRSRCRRVEVRLGAAIE